MDKILLKTYKKYTDSEVLFNVLNNGYDLEFALMLKKYELEVIEDSQVFLEKLRSLGILESVFNDQDIIGIFEYYEEVVFRNFEPEFVITSASLINNSFKKESIEILWFSTLGPSIKLEDFPLNTVYINNADDYFIVFSPKLPYLNEDSELFELELLLNKRK
jgi:hypothetical protein